MKIDTQGVFLIVFVLSLIAINITYFMVGVNHPVRHMYRDWKTKGTFIVAFILHSLSFVCYVGIWKFACFDYLKELSMASFALLVMVCYLFYRKRSQSKDCTIYVVDDQEDVLEVLDMNLTEMFSCDTMLFTNLNDLMEKLQGPLAAPDLILCDVKLAGESGFAIKDKLKSANLVIPVIFITSMLSGPDVMNEDGYTVVSKSMNKIRLKRILCKAMKC